MGKRAKCNVCGSYSYDVFYAWNHRDPCPRCGASEEDSIALDKAGRLRKKYLSKDADKELVDKNSFLVDENEKLKIKVNSLYGTVHMLEVHVDDFVEHFKKYVDAVGKIKSILEEGE